MFKRKLHDIFLIGGLFFILIFGFPQIIHAIVDPIMAEDIRECKQSANSVFDLGDLLKRYFLHIVFCELTALFCI